MQHPDIRPQLHTPFDPVHLHHTSYPKCTYPELFNPANLPKTSTVQIQHTTAGFKAL